MAEEEKKTQKRRPATRLWIWAEQWLWGSTRAELTHEERAIFADFLCLASLKGGYIECYSRDQLASQLCVNREILDQAIDKFIKTQKIRKNYKKREKKEIFFIRKWEQYQPEYLWQRPLKSTKRTRSAKELKSDAHVDPIREEKKGEKKRREKRKGE